MYRVKEIQKITIFFVYSRVKYLTIVVIPGCDDNDFGMLLDVYDSISHYSILIIIIALNFIVKPLSSVVVIDGSRNVRSLPYDLLPH